MLVKTEQKSFEKKVGFKLRKLREAKGLTQEKLAEEFKVSQYRIYSIEAAVVHVSFFDLCKLCDYYEVSTMEVISYATKSNDG